MKQIIRYSNVVVMFSVLTFTVAKAALVQRFEQLDNDRGDVPGWAIASGAACVLAAFVYAAYSRVITKWVGKIS